jgi:hypothetical protein
MDRYPARYESQVYGGGSGSNNHSPSTANAPTPHNMPRSGLGYDHLDMYSSRPDEGNWGPDVSLVQVAVRSWLIGVRLDPRLSKRRRTPYHMVMDRGATGDPGKTTPIDD